MLIVGYDSRPAITARVLTEAWGAGREGASVERRNPAQMSYERHGFRDAGPSDPAATGPTMIATL